MRQRNWIFYKIVLYLGLLAAITLLGVLCFFAFSRGRGLWMDSIFQLVMLGAILQMIFYLLCVRLVHYYVTNRTTPGNSFSVLYIVLLVINSGISTGLLLLLAYGFSQTFLQAGTRPGREDYLALSVVGGYTFISVYLSAASVILKRYNRYQAATDEEGWLSRLGSASTDS